MTTEEATEEAAAETEEAPAPELVYGSTQEWLTEWLLPTYRRYISPNGSQSTWCPSWWMHAEAVIRLEALWRAWEYLRLDGQTGSSVWWKDHADYHLATLLDPQGPFHGCTSAGHGELHEQFPVNPAPAGFFPDVRVEPTSASSDQRKKDDSDE